MADRGREMASGGCFPERWSRAGVVESVGGDEGVEGG